jgi:hypothetical protein
VCPLITKKLLIRLEKFKLFWNQRIAERVQLFLNFFFFVKYFLDFFSCVALRLAGGLGVVWVRWRLGLGGLIRAKPSNCTS